MTFGAMLGGKQTLAACGVPRLLEETRGIEIGKQIGRRLFGQVACRHTSLAHSGPHSRRVIPHGGRERRRREVAVNALAEIGPNGSTFSVNAMALNAGQRFKQLRAAHRVRREGGGMEGQGRSGNNYQDSRHHRVNLNPVVTT